MEKEEKQKQVLKEALEKVARFYKCLDAIKRGYKTR